MADTSNFILPNVSVCKDQANVVHYNPYVEPQETRLVCKYNVTSTSSPTALRTNYEQNIFKSMEIDGVMLDELVTAYTFNTTGVHTVKYELYDETKLGNNAPTFFNDNLIEAIIPDSVTTIGSAFQNCSKLASVTIPDSVTSIGGYAFANCTSLISIDIPDGVTSIGSAAFSNCSSLSRLSSDVDGVFNIPSSVTSIGQSAFSSCSGLTSVVIPDSVTSIGSSAFDNCSSLTSVTIGNSVTSIGSSAFQNCSSLTSVTIGNSVTSIGSQAFTYCSSLTNVTIPDSVTSIGSHAFRYCDSLTSVTVKATTHPALGDRVFDNNASGRKIYVPSASVNDYKAATSWSVYADAIEPIP